jgi:hypothetical protein
LSRKSWFPLSGRNIAEQPRSANPQAGAAKLLTFLGSTPTISGNGHPHNSVHRPEVEIGGTLANFSTVFGPFFDRFAEVIPD